MKANYWSNSKFANWIRGTDTSKYLSMKEWDIWEQKAKDAHPIRYWIAETLLDNIQNILHYPFKKVEDVRVYLHNRFITKTHYFKTKLKPGKWYEFETRLLHSVFEELVDFVEIELASMHVCWNEDKWYEFVHDRFFGEGLPKLRIWRSPEAGMDYLATGKKDVFDEPWIAEDDPQKGKPTPHAEYVTELDELYKWWKFKRPARIEPYNEYGTESYKALDPFAKREALDKMGQMEENYNKEDEDMLIRVIKLRQSIWT